MRVRRYALSAIAVLALASNGCGSPGPKGFDTPEKTLLALRDRIAAEDGKGACRLFLPGGAAAFARSFEAKDCPAAMDTVIGRVTDRKGFKSYVLKPSGEYPGVEITGDGAKFGGACTGWTDGAVTSGLKPGNLGYFGLKKTDQGWLINDNRLPNTSCGG